MVGLCGRSALGGGLISERPWLPPDEDTGGVSITTEEKMAVDWVRFEELFFELFFELGPEPSRIMAECCAFCISSFRNASIPTGGGGDLGISSIVQESAPCLCTRR